MNCCSLILLLLLFLYCSPYFHFPSPPSFHLSFSFSYRNSPFSFPLLFSPSSFTSLFIIVLLICFEIFILRSLPSNSSSYLGSYSFSFFLFFLTFLIFISFPRLPPALSPFPFLLSPFPIHFRNFILPV